MGVVQLDGHHIGQVLQGAVGGQVILHDVADGSGRQEVLLAQAEDLALDVVVVGVQDLGNQLSRSALAHGGAVVAQREAGHIKIGSLGLPQAQLGDAGSVVALDVHVGRHSHDAVVVQVLDIVEAVVPVLADFAVKADLDGLLGVALEPDLTAGQPVVGPLLLPAVDDLLLEDAVLIQDRVAGAADAGGSHAVQIAGSQTAQTAVAQTCVGLFLVDGVDVDVGRGQCILADLVQAEIHQADLEAAAHQELHAQIIHLLGARADDLRLELLVVVAHHLTADQGQSTIDLLVGGNRQINAVLTGQLVLQKGREFLTCHTCNLLSIYGVAWVAQLFDRRHPGTGGGAGCQLHALRCSREVLCVFRSAQTARPGRIRPTKERGGAVACSWWNEDGPSGAIGFSDTQ